MKIRFKFIFCFSTVLYEFNFYKSSSRFNDAMDKNYFLVIGKAFHLFSLAGSLVASSQYGVGVVVDDHSLS